MAGEGFDAVIAALARARSRRAIIAALASAVTIGGILGNGTPTNAGEVIALPQCRGVRSKCRRGAQCCSGRCRKRRGKNTNKKNKKKGKCRCSRFLEPCRKDGDCCSGEVPLVCASGTCQT